MRFEIDFDANDLMALLGERVRVLTEYLASDVSLHKALAHYRILGELNSNDIKWYKGLAKNPERSKAPEQPQRTNAQYANKVLWRGQKGTRRWRLEKRLRKLMKAALQGEEL